MITIEELQQQTATAERKAREARAEYEFAKKYPQYNCAANFEILRRVHNGEEITLASLEELIQHSQIKSMLTVLNEQQIFNRAAQQRADEQAAQEKAQKEAREAEDAERQRLIPQILSLLKVSPLEKESERRKCLVKDIKELRTRLQNLKDVSVWRGATKEQLKEHLRATKPAQSTEYPALPRNISAEQIRLMWDAATLRQMIKKYGSQQITERLQEYQEN